ncbi:MAG: N-acetylmuramate alpha-1-phosphate uridylyltransferase MurU [Pseudomonadota bacterium]
MKAMIFAAGRGTRMGALTEQTPKPMLDLAHMPLIEYHIRALASAGIGDIVINVAYLAEQITQTLGDGSRFGVRIQYSHESQGALETAGGIAQALPLLGSDPFLVVNGDVWTDFGLHRLRGVELGASIDAHLVMVPNPPHHRLGDFAFSAKASPVHNERQRLLCPPTPEHTRTFTYSGIGLYRPSLFSAVQGKVPLGPLLRTWIAEQRITAQRHTGYWWDVGTPQRLESVVRFLTGDHSEDVVDSSAS